MNVEISVPEVVEIFKEIQEQPKQIFEMIRVEIRESVGQYLSKLMAMELTHFLGRERYERCLLYTSPSPRDLSTSRMPSSA